MLHKEIPFLRIGVPLCSGIIAGLVFSPGNSFFLISSAATILFFLLSLLFNRYLVNTVYGISLTMALFLCGLLLYTEEKGSISELESAESVFTGTISDYPEEKENTFMMRFRLDKKIYPDHEENISGSMVLYNRKDIDRKAFIPGDRLIIRCTPVEISNRGNPAGFDYRFYMKNRGIRYYAFTDSSDIRRQSPPAHRKLTHKALIIREKIIDIFRERGISGERLALVAAITLGQKSLLDPEQKQYFMKAGIMHIMAVSGLHAMILSLFVFRALFFLKGRFSILRVLITVIALWIFAFVTGLTSSVLRATLMFTFLWTGKIIKRPVNGINSVLASAFVLIMIRPSVIFDAGFLLSYSAVIFIISFYRRLYQMITFRHRLTDLIWQTTAVTLIAQAGTLPLTLMLFNRFPTWFILSNIFIVPFASMVIITGVLVPLTYPAGFLSQFFSFMLSNLAGLTERMTETAASLPFSTIDNLGLSISECILLTVTIFLFLQFFLERKSIQVIYPLIALLALTTTGTLQSFLTRNSGELVVYNTKGYTAVGIRSGKILNLYSDSLPAGPEVLRHASARRLKISPQLMTRNSFQITVDNTNILITNTLNNYRLSSASPDIVILKGLISIEQNLKTDLSNMAIIVAPVASAGYRGNLVLRSLKADTLHFVRNEGAFRLRL